MAELERRIGGLLEERGVEVYGLAGPDRLHGPPSMNPGDSLWRARPIASPAPSMQVGATGDFLGTRSPVPQNVDQLEGGVGRDGVRGEPSTLTCGQCALVCGPTLAETRRRHHILMGGGIVVPGPDGRMVRVESCEQVFEYKNRHGAAVSRDDGVADSRVWAALWRDLYVGFEPVSYIRGTIHDSQLKRPLRGRSRRAAAAPRSTRVRPERETEVGS